MNINLANIDFAPGQGGGEAIIRALDVTANGTYRAPSGVDGYSPVRVNVSGGGSVTPEEQAALDTLVNSSEGTLYTDVYKTYYQVIDNGASNVWKLMRCFDDLYYISYGVLYKLNRETYQFDRINYFNGMYSGPSFFGDKSGRFYFDGRELDLENGTIGQDSIELPNLYEWESLSNVFYGEYGVWILNFDSAYKFNESSQEFEEMTLNSTFPYSGSDMFALIFKYDGHILGMYNGLTYEVTEYEDHIDVADVTDVYFNRPSFGYAMYGFKSTKDGDLYYIAGYDVYKYDKSLGDWVSIDDKSIIMPIYGYNALTADNFIFSTYNGSLYYMNLGSELNVTSWKEMYNIAVDLKSNQTIKGEKNFNVIRVNQLLPSYIVNENTSVNIENLKISSQNIDINGSIKINGRDAVSYNDLIGSITEAPYGPVKEKIDVTYNYYTNNYAWFNINNRIFGRDMNYGNIANELTNNGWVQHTFSTDIMAEYIYYAGNDTYMIGNGPNGACVYKWDDTNTDWVILPGSETSWDYGSTNVYFYDGSSFRYGLDWKLVDLGNDTYEWVSDSPGWPNFYSGSYVYLNGHTYVNNYDTSHLFEFDTTNHTYTDLGWVGTPGSPMRVLFGKIFIENYGMLKYVDFTKVDPNDSGKSILSDEVIISLNSSDAFYGSNGVNLYCFVDNGDFCKTYGESFSKPEVPSSNGTYTLKAVRVGDQITYSWVLDV